MNKEDSIWFEYEVDVRKPPAICVLFTIDWLPFLVRTDYYVLESMFTAKDAERHSQKSMRKESFQLEKMHL